MQANEVADAAGLQARYVEEWLKGMTAAGYLEYDSAADAYALPEEHAFLLASEGTDHFMGGLFYVEPVLLGAAPKVADCFRTGGGVRFEDFGPECVVALDMINSGHSRWPMAVRGLVLAWDPSARKRCFAQPASAGLRCSISRARPTSSMLRDRDHYLGGVQVFRPLRY